jgi:hypothetical protein
VAGLVDAAKSGDRRKTLEALRDKIASSIQDCESGRDVAALSKRLMEVMGELDAMPKPSEDDELAELQELYG